MRLSPRWKRVLVGLLVLGILELLELKAADRPACTPDSCLLSGFSNSQ